MVDSGKTNLRKIHSWTMTEAYSLHAALLLREVTTIMQQPKTKMSDAIVPTLCIALHNTEIRSSIAVASPSHTLIGDRQTSLVSDHTSCAISRAASSPLTTSVPLDLTPSRPSPMSSSTVASGTKFNDISRLPHSIVTDIHVDRKGPTLATTSISNLTASSRRTTVNNNSENKTIVYSDVLNLSIDESMGARGVPPPSSLGPN